MPLPRGTERGVGLHDADVVHRHAEQLGDDHRERGLVTLAVRAGADRRDHRAVVFDLDAAELLEQTTGA